MGSKELGLPRPPRGTLEPSGGVGGGGGTYAGQNGLRA